MGLCGASTNGAVYPIQIKCVFGISYFTTTLVQYHMAKQSRVLVPCWESRWALYILYYSKFPTIVIVNIPLWYHYEKIYVGIWDICSIYGL